MKIISGLKQLRKFKNPVVALGVFDGVHLGHRKILDAAVTKARSIGGVSIVLTFWPHPQKEESLYSLEHRLRLISRLGLDICIVVNFNKRFAGVMAEDFIKNVLFKKISARYIYVGKNFRFGKGAEGNLKTLEKLSKDYNFQLKAFEVARINDLPISSTFIRSLIKKGKLSAAGKLLGRPVSILGTVIRGNSLAGRWGFPTANINPHHEVIPPAGIYAAKIIYGKKKFNGACYIGTRPTLAHKRGKTKRPQPVHIEAHIFNFNRNIYGKYLEIQFVKRIRKDKKFASSDLLIKQIKKDLFCAKKLLSPTIHYHKI